MAHYAYDDVVNLIRSKLEAHLQSISTPVASKLHSFEVANAIQIQPVEVHVTYDYAERSWFMAIVVEDERRAVARVNTPLSAYAPAVIHAELTALIEEALRGPLEAPKPEPAILPGELTFGEVRSALAAGTLARIAPVAHLLSEMGEEGEDMREYARHQLAHDSLLPWPVGWVGYDGPGQISVCVPALLRRPQGVVHGAGVVTRRLVSRALGQLASKDLRRIGLDGAVLDVSDALVKDYERWQWMGMQAKLIELALTYSSPTSGEVVRQLGTIPLDEYAWSAGAQDVVVAWRNALRVLDGLDGGLRTPLDRVREALSYGPSLHGLAYATWAAAAPLSWGIEAHHDGIWLHTNRRRGLVPQGVTAINAAIVQPAIHVELRRLMEAGR